MGLVNTLETARLLLRPRQEGDAAVLGRWEESGAESGGDFQAVLSAPEVWVLVPRGETEPIGAVSLRRGRVEGEAELGCALAAPNLEQGLAAEALDCLLTRAFKEGHFSALWYSCGEDDSSSRRVQEELGFFFHHAEETPAEGAGRGKTFFSRLTRAEWEKRPAVPLHFKDAEPEDYDAALSLIRQLWTYNTYDREELLPVYQRVLREKDSFAFFLLDGEEHVLGFCHGAFFPTFWLSGETCYVSSVITVPEVRGSGCGRRLLDHVKELAAKRSCKGLVLDSGFPRKEAHRFYEKYGFEKSCYGFDLCL